MMKLAHADQKLAEVINPTLVRLMPPCGSDPCPIDAPMWV